MRAISLKISVTAGAVTSVRTPDATTNGPGGAAEHELRAGAVGVAVLLAQVQVDAAREQPAERLVHHLQSPRSRASRAARRCVATRSCVCGAPGLSTITQPRRGRRRARRAPAAAGVPLLPVAERLLDERPQLGHRDLARHDSAALFGTKFCVQNACMSSRVIALFDASVPSSV